MRLKINKSTLQGEIRIPASKSHTIRAVALAGIAEGKSVLENPLFSADTISCIKGIQEFGAEVVQGDTLVIKGTGGLPKPACKKIDAGNSGTSLRILTGLAALADFPVMFDGDSSIRQRPMTPLLTALENLGATIRSADGRCPFTIRGPIRGGKTTVDGISSQFLTSLLLACPLCTRDTEIIVENLHEKPYVEMTLDWLKKLSISFEQNGLDWFRIPGGQKYLAFERSIPADFSSATFAACAAAITGSEILIKGLDFSDHQGDKEIFTFLGDMGAQIKHVREGVILKGGNLRGIDIDMNNTPDALPAFAVAGCFAEGTTRLLNVAQARFKECDRISAITTELTKMGGKLEELRDGLVIHQSVLKGCELHGYHDHRMVMALSVAGMMAEGDTIVDTAESIRITYPGYLEDMKAIGARMEMADN
ncbi:MAG: 3-phosphoshikimate 1-carboxyvinyltransferase [Bacteroidales bacterium]|nr:3-phosphoshikimate 1-carboxyvinyltransferase [Bacteroidales bacterium]